MPEAWRWIVDDKKRVADGSRITKETDIELILGLDGGSVSVSTGVPFLDHMLTLFAFHGGFALAVRARGDTKVDDHHLVEDAGICLGKAFAKALGDKKGIRRYGEALVPMDEALAQAALDISGRSQLSYGLLPGSKRIKEFDLSLVEEFLLGFTRNVPCTLHLKSLAGRNAHHIVEAGFKAFGLAAGRAVERADPGRSDTSSKGVV